MKKLIASLLLVPALSYSQTLKAELSCFPLQDVVTSLTKDYKEMVRWAGSKDRLEYLLFLNPQTKTWSLGFTDGKTFCSLGEGVGFVEVNVNKNPL